MTTFCLLTEFHSNHRRLINILYKFTLSSTNFTYPDGLQSLSWPHYSSNLNVHRTVLPSLITLASLSYFLGHTMFQLISTIFLKKKKKNIQQSFSPTTVLFTRENITAESTAQFCLNMLQSFLNHNTFFCYQQSLLDLNTNIF